VGIIHHGKMRYEGDLDTLRASVRLVRLPAQGRRDGGPTLASSHGDEVPQREVEEAGASDLAIHRPGDSLASGEGGVVKGNAADSGAPTDAAACASATSPSQPVTSGGLILPPAFEVLRDDTRDGVRSLVLQASPSAWDTAPLPDGEISRLSLEDIFIALVGTAPAGI
jgi:hypothetical protein